jgi:hypothetical protein
MTSGICKFITSCLISQSRSVAGIAHTTGPHSKNLSFNPKQLIFFFQLKNKSMYFYDVIKKFFEWLTGVASDFWSIAKTVR